ncbi:flagellar filament capping protein FliD [Algibacillus agarilyticus]|uniref:flagellar filament capping protein FliD n=1 Tax=Algibacillus agarilyticus TaxID=2234133 RepID=UPI000DCFE588|nr:flagellar filament capping protein FliD [Algibacillus agarilyticus]
MGISSIGVGSGLDLNGLVTQLLDAESAPKYARLDKQEDEIEAEISGVGQLKSKMDDFKDAVDELRNSYDLQGRKAVTTHPSSTEEDKEIFTAEAANSASQGSYEITIDSLATGSRYESADASYTDSSQSVSTAGGLLTFQTGVSGETFDVTVSAGMTLTELAAAVNSASETYVEDNTTSSSSNVFGVLASIIDTGTAAGAKIVFTSQKTGTGNDLQIVNTTDDAELDNLSTQSSGGGALANLNETKTAADATATIDGIAVASETNEFENVIENVSFTAEYVSEFDYTDSGTGEDVYKTSRLSVGADKDGLKNKITDFVDNYNSLMDEITTLTKYGQSELEDDGALAGDYMARGIQNGLSSIISGSVSTSSLGTLFQIGVSFDDDGKLQISETDEFGLGSGIDRLDESLDDSYDDIATLFSDSDEGIASNLYDYVYEYTTYGGLLRSREQGLKDQKELLNDQRIRVDLQISNYEQIIRDKYINLDLTVSKLNRTSGSLSASLGLLG